jgi:uncharacterized membrane protein
MMETAIESRKGAMKISWRREIPHLAVIAALFACATAVWNVVPDRLPVHWNLAGEADRYGGKFEGVLLIPLIALGLYWLLLLLPFLDPKRENYARFATAYRAIRWCLTLFLTSLYAMTLAAAMGRPVDMSLAISLLMAAFFIMLGVMMSNVKPNWFVGVRTPWTLSSDLSWKKTHHLAKWVFIALGASFVPLGVSKSELALAAVLTVGFGGVFGLVVYSYVVWRTDPNRSHSGAATS